MATTYATPSDVAAELGVPAPVPGTPLYQQYERWISRATSQVRARIPDLDARAAADPNYRDVVADVIVSAAARKARNPEGYRSTSTTVDDATISRTRDHALSDGEIRITDEEWALITPLGAAFTARIRYDPGWPR